VGFVHESLKFQPAKGRGKTQNGVILSEAKKLSAGFVAPRDL
jgi:hypothetical protein